MEEFHKIPGELLSIEEIKKENHKKQEIYKHKDVNANLHCTNMS